MPTRKVLCIVDESATTANDILARESVHGNVIKLQDILDGKEQINNGSLSQVQVVIAETIDPDSPDMKHVTEELCKASPDIVLAFIGKLPNRRVSKISNRHPTFVEVAKLPGLITKEWASEAKPSDNSYLCSYGSQNGQHIREVCSDVFTDAHYISTSIASPAGVCNIIGAMQAMECIAISEAFVVCHRLGISKSELLQVLRYGSAMSAMLGSFLTKSGKGKFFPTKHMLNEWSGFLEAMCVQARCVGLPYTLPQTALGTLATLASELRLIEGSEKDGFASLEQQTSHEDTTAEINDKGRQESKLVLVVGLGLMGSGIAEVLSKSANTLGYDIDECQNRHFAEQGGTVSKDIQKDCEKADFVVIVVENEGQVHEVLFDGPHPITDHLRKDAIVVIHSTVPSNCALDIQKRVSDTKPDVVILDAPMSGTPTKAGKGELLVILGGSAEHCANFEPFLRLYTSQILRFPRLGLASQLKLIHNTVAGLNLMAAAYTMKLGHSMKIDRSSLHGLILDTNARSTYFEDRIPRILSEENQPSAYLSVWLKDLSLAVKENGIREYFSPLLAHALETYRAAAALQGDDAGDHNVYDIW